ncbi:hypothetical protein SmJEL517_g01115 [Synchytrium microbalum]|uniref:Nephrocystin-4 n=1 Tax=Synchytrium microbalum TaxID=1806994 RepID=A0A507CCJ6_9FUNG|nr:uncharacterized protein SmJEL517_g01115 [Synchytrium microbalum]TPX37068.1 hypothetical protein SmJEL517_g01115 [Synchytrium microbalum]
MEEHHDWARTFRSFVPYTQRDSQRIVPTSTKSQLHFPYSLTISRLEGITLPPIITESYLNSDGPMSCRVRATFFDVTSAQFYGKTWASPRYIRIRKAKTVNDGERHNDGGDDDRDTEDGSEEDDEEIYSADVALVGNRLTATLHDLHIYFHTPVTEPDTIIVLEFVLQVVNGLESTSILQNIGIGWTFIHPFDPMKNGLDCTRVWSDAASSLMEPVAKLMPIYVGTPRMLPVIAPLLLGQMLGFPALTPIPSALCTYKLTTCQSLRHVCHYIRENEFIGYGDIVSGVRFKDEYNLEALETSTASFSQASISIRVQPSVQQFEENLVKIVAQTFCETHQIPPSEPLAPPTILERRLNLGFHNGRTFLTPPTTITLTPVINADDTTGNELKFQGNVQLDSFVPEDKDVVVIVLVEYKVNVVRSMPADDKDTSAAAVRARRMSIRQFENAGVEQVVLLGWAIWKPLHKDETEIRQMPLINSIEPNPFLASMYRPADLLNGIPPMNVSFVFTGAVAPSPASSPVRSMSRSMSYGERPKTPKSPRTRSIPPSPTKAVPIAPLISLPPPARAEPALVPEAMFGDQDSLMELSGSLPSPAPMNAVLSSSSLRSKLTRAEKARLASAGFAPILDSEGRKPTVLSLDDVEAPVNLALELQDTKLNDVTLTLMGLSIVDGVNASPNRVFFTFKFWTYPQVLTSPVQVYTGALPPSERSKQIHSDEQTKTNTWPGIFYSFEHDGSTPAYRHAPGLSFTYSGDEETSPKQIASRYAATTFRHYLASKILQVFLWDADSHMCLGSCDIELKSVLRRGKNAIMFDDSVAIISSTQTTEVADTTNMLQNKVGSLFLKWTNISRKGTMNSISLSKPILYDYHESIKVHPEVKKLGSRMQDTDPELSEMLREAHAARVKGLDASRAAENAYGAVSAQNERKLAKARRVLRQSDATNSKSDANEKDEVFQTYQLSRQERQRDLQAIEIFRERKKRLVIGEELTKEITTHHTIYASLGLACYFEIVFTNPYNYDAKFDVSFDDAELRIVSNPAMLKYLRRTYHIIAPLDKEPVFSVKRDGSTEMFLLANEKMSVPFVFQTFCSAQARVTTVSFFNNDQKPVALLDVRVIPTGHFVDRVAPFFRPENEVFKSVLRFESPPSRGPLASILPDGITTIYDAAHPDARYLRCGNAEVSCQLGSTTMTNTHDLSFKAVVQPASAGSETLSMLLFDDPFFLSLVCIWSIPIHALHRFDVQCVFGQETKTQLIVRGGSASRTCRLYSNSSEVVHATGMVALPAQILAEVPVIAKPLTFGVKEVVVNLMDEHYLVASYLVVLHAKPPAITKTFELALPRSKLVNKRVTYTNPYPNKRTFVISTNSPQLLTFKEPILELKREEAGYIKMQFAPTGTRVDTLEVLVFIAEDRGVLDECICIKIKYTD